MNRLKKLLINMILILTAGAAPLLAAEADYMMDKNKDGKTDQWYYKEGANVCKVEVDSNFDGVLDSLTVYNKEGQKEKEEYDFNFDGKMDDFSFFEKGMLVRREIDSNYDNKIDVWVFLSKGIYVKKIERDKDFDGKVDYTKEY